MRLSSSMLALIATAAAPLIAADPGAAYTPAAPAGQDRPMLGVQMTPVPLQVQEQEGLTPNQGVLVQSVFGNTAASSMGLQAGDVILGVNGAPIGSMNDLRNEVSLNQVGDPVNVTVERQGQQLTESSNFQPWPSNIPYEPIDPAMESNFRNWQENRLNQLNQEANDMQNQAQALAHKLGLDPNGGPGSASTAPGDANPADLFAWHFRYGLGLAAAAPSAGVTATPQDQSLADAIAYGVVIPTPWRFNWQVSSVASRSAH